MILLSMVSSSMKPFAPVVTITRWDIERFLGICEFGSNRFIYREGGREGGRGSMVCVWSRYVCVYSYVPPSSFFHISGLSTTAVNRHTDRHTSSVIYICYMYYVHMYHISCTVVYAYPGSSQGNVSHASHLEL